MKIYSVYDPEFKPYGKTLEGYDTAELRAAMKAGPERGGCREIRLAPDVRFDALKSQVRSGLSNADIPWWNAVKGFTTTGSGNVIIRW